MFELNPDLEVKEEILLESKIFIIDNFYKNPDEVYDFLFNRDVPLWKMEEKPSFNTIHFNTTINNNISYNFFIKRYSFEFIKEL